MTTSEIPSVFHDHSVNNFWQCSKKTHKLCDLKSCLKSILGALDYGYYIKFECAACVIWTEEEWGECAFTSFPTCVLRAGYSVMMQGWTFPGKTNC